MLNFLERSFWLSVLLLAGLAVLLAGTLARLGGGLPPLRPLQPQTGAPPRFFSADRAEDWFAAPLLARLAIPTNTVNPFYTLYFQPPPPPPAAHQEGRAALPGLLHHLEHAETGLRQTR